jgi:hypothetical protein
VGAVETHIRKNTRDGSISYIAGSRDFDSAAMADPP